ncbi:MAG: ATP-binding protein [Muribaculaceae bacterium]|nr:ATP-binding protein [Muribaculaceae bacterium]
MKRLIYNDLLSWKNRADRKPLILLGARQVGKTYILKEFGTNEFSHMVYVNCHKNEFAKSLFRDFSVERIILELERFYEVKIVPGESIVIFDEIQEVQDGLAALKYFCEDMPSLHVAVAGSLLGISLKEDESYPVGKVNTMRMYPMTFTEYLLACGRSQLVDMLNSLDWQSINVFAEVLTDYLRQYYFVGGMPEAVLSYINTGDTSRVREVQNEILDAYMRDISKHSKLKAERIRQLWNSIPAQLARENKKFIFGAIKKSARSAEYEDAIQWLVDAGLIYKVERVSAPSMPLKFYCDYSAFKLFLIDCGLLASMSEASPKDLLLGSNAFVEFKGAFTENYVLQQIKATADTLPFYYSKDNSTMEVDFLCQLQGRIIPIEVKAEVNVKSKSLNNFVNIDFADKHFKALRISMKPYIDQGWMENIPLYAAESYFRNLKT